VVFSAEKRKIQVPKIEKNFTFFTTLLRMEDDSTTDRRSRGRENAVVLAQFTEAQLIALWDQHKRNVTSTDACWLWSGSTQNGYPSVSQGHGKSKLKIHMLAAWTVTRSFPTAGQVVSHRCHRKTCVNPDHLIIESIAANNARKGCLCSFVDATGRVWNLCWHTPRCLRIDTDTVGTFVAH